MVRKTTYGYVMILSPNHTLKDKQNCILEHRLIMEEYLKLTNPKSKYLININGELYLNPKLIVHHKNGIKDDNKIENLKVMSKEKHHSLHNSKQNNPNWKGGITNNWKEYNRLLVLNKRIELYLCKISQNYKIRSNILKSTKKYLIKELKKDIKPFYKGYKRRKII